MSGMIANPSALSVPHSLQKSNLACWPSQNLARRPSLIGQSSALPSLYHLQEALKRRRGFVQTRFVSARKPTLTMIFVPAFRLFPGAFVSTGCREDGDEPGRPWPASGCASVHPDRGHSGRLCRKGHSPACRRRTVRQGELISLDRDRFRRGKERPRARLTLASRPELLRLDWRKCTKCRRSADQSNQCRPGTRRGGRFAERLEPSQMQLRVNSGPFRRGTSLCHRSRRTTR